MKISLKRPLRSRLTLAVVLVSLNLTATSAIGAEQQGSVGGCLLLNNGRVLYGSVTPTGDYYQVAVPYGEVRIRLSDVEAIGRDLVELYDHKRRLAETSGCTERLRLVEWCHTNGLGVEAAIELEFARQLDPSHPDISRVERRIRSAVPQPLATAATAPFTIPQVKHAVALSPRQSDASRVAINDLPPGAIETFARGIQPLLANRCATSGCHGHRAQSTFALTPLTHGNLASQRLTQSNLQAVLAQIDSESPQESPLLKAAIGPHGPLTTGILTGVQAEQYDRLDAWTRYVAQGVPASETEMPRDEPTRSDVQRATYEEEIPSAESSAFDVSEDDASGIALDEVLGAPGGQSKVQRGAPFRGFIPADPFDPEIFNRRYFPGDRR